MPVTKGGTYVTGDYEQYDLNRHVFEHYSPFHEPNSDLFGYRFGGPMEVQLKTLEWHDDVRARAPQEAAAKDKPLEVHMGKTYGMRESPSPFWSLTYWRNIFGAERGVQLDLMHLMYNIAVALFLVILPGMKLHDNAYAPCALSPTQMTLVQKRFRSISLPSPYTDSMKNLMKGAREGTTLPKTKTIDFVKCIQFDLLPFALLDIVSPAVFCCVNSICKFLRILLSFEVGEVTIRVFERYLWTGLQRLEVYVPATQRGGWQWHLLLHLANLMRSDGPLVDAWNFSLESLLGVIKTWVKNRQFPIQAIAKVQNVRLALRTMKVRKI